MLGPEDKSFGNSKKFDIGDIVSWSILHKRRAGVVSSASSVELGGRKVKFAKVLCFEDGKVHEVLCLNIKIVSKNDSTTVKH